MDQAAVQLGTSVVKCNGFLSDPFRIEKSVRQGCPLSGVLYAVTTEPLVQSILKDENISGIPGPGLSVFKLALYADNVNIMVRDEASCNVILGHLRVYERHQGQGKQSKFLHHGHGRGWQSQKLLQILGGREAL